MAAVNGQKLMLAACGVAIAAVVLWLALTSGDAIGRGGAPDVAVPVDPVAADRAPRDLPSDVGERVAVTSDAGEPDRAPIVVGRVLDAWGDPATALVGDAASAEPVRTGERGEFELPLGRRGTVHLLALANGHAPLPVACEVAVDARAVDLGELQLLAGGAIRGNVVDAGGDGVEGATVTPTLLAAERLPAGFDAGLLVMPRMTGVAGAFVIPHLLPGTYRLAVTAPGRQRAESASITVRDAADTELPPIVLAAGHDLVGRVLTAEDVPIADAEVRVRCRTPRVRGQVASGTDGGFSFAGMPPGPLLDVEVRRPGFLRSELHGVDASRDGELVIRLEPGLAIAGVAVAARDGRPVERFAVACRRVGDLAPMSNGTVEQQLARRAEALRTEALASAEAERSDELLRLARELETRRATVPGDRLDLPGATAMDAGAAESRPGGRFRIEGLEEGLYDVGVAADGFAFARIGGVRVERGAPAPELRFDLDEGLAVVGQVRAAREHTPLAGATVELVAVTEIRAAPVAPPSPFAWLFARPGPSGIAIRTTVTAGDGTFTFADAPAGRYRLTVRHPAMAEHDTAVFELTRGRREVDVELLRNARLRGRVVGAAIGRQAGVAVLVLGGYGTQRTVRADAAGRYVVDGLQPGRYLVRAFPADASRYVDRLLGELFPERAGELARVDGPRPDVELAPGQDAVLDVALDVQPTGGVRGTVAVNGRAAGSARIVLRPLPGEAPGSGGLPLRATCDDRGVFAFADVPAGSYTLSVYGSSRAELHREAIAVAPGGVTQLAIDTEAGGVQGRVVAAGGTRAEELRGSVWILPGATEEPADLYAFRRDHRTHRLRIRDGAFADVELTPGAALAVVDLPGRRRVVQSIAIPARGTVAIELPAGERR